MVVSPHVPKQPNPEGEDDAVIGVALKRSLGVILPFVLLGTVFLWWQASPKEETVIEKQVAPVRGVGRELPPPPSVTFVDVTKSAGLTFSRENGARGEKWLPETMGGGCAFLDADQDGDQDLILINGTTWDRTPGHQATLAFFRNDGSGQFQEETQAMGLAISLQGTGIAVGDIDNDGWPDLVVTALGPNRLFKNERGKFIELQDSVIAGGQSTWSTSAGFFDYDRDGNLDLFVSNYVRWSQDIDRAIHFTINGRDRAYGPPTDYQGEYCRLYRNLGDGQFEDVSEKAGILVNNPNTGKPMAKALAVHFTDLDRDGFPDVLVANDTVANLLFHNQGDGSFQEVGAQSGFAFGSDGNATGAMGMDSAYYRNNQSLAIAVGNFANEMSSFYVHRGGDMLLSDDAIGEGVGAPSRARLTFGLFFLDYDLDGRQDLLQVNGHLEEEISQLQAGQEYRQPAQLFWNAGFDHAFAYAEVPREETGDLAKPIVGRGAAYADIDGDGDLDLLFVQPKGSPLLLRNDQQTGHGWLRCRLIGTSDHRDAIGALVQVISSSGSQSQRVNPTRSYLSQVEKILTFGLGNDSIIDRIDITWPNGQTQSIGPTGINQELVITQTKSTE